MSNASRMAIDTGGVPIRGLRVLTFAREEMLMPEAARGPLKGIRIVEFVGLGPAPFAAMQFADMGADVVRIARPGAAPLLPDPITGRGRPSVEADLKNAGDVALVAALVERADALIEGFRPGVMERLGLGPEEMLARNPRLVYGRMTGWGQTGPLAQRAGHDINYIAVTGALAAIGPTGYPVPPLNLVGDFGGGCDVFGQRHAGCAAVDPTHRSRPGCRRRHLRWHVAVDGDGP